ncbi:MAG: IS3 family transposase [Brachybacterium sp.]|uniref:IS3 family transposase n=1 Tax=Brachybacterium sp. TaxID=1891286 RepID=UPI0032428BE2
MLLPPRAQYTRRRERKQGGPRAHHHWPPRPLPGGERTGPQTRCRWTPARRIFTTMQIELLNRKKWKTRIELANAIFKYVEVFYNRRRRHSSLEYATPHDYDLARTQRALATTGS